METACTRNFVQARSWLTSATADAHIDALDEYVGDNDIRGILQLLSLVKTTETIRPPIFVTSVEG
jgi:hypothetical protein